MPELSRFYGIVIHLRFGDHNPPHFHAAYGEYEASVSIENLAILAGRLPPRAAGMVIEWAALHQDELRECWQKAQQGQSIGRIAPLD
jgi:phosphomannomutase